MASNKTADVRSDRIKQAFAMIEQGMDVDVQTITEFFDSWTSYDKDVEKMKYRAPSVVASALAEHGTRKDISVLDCGSGTGLLGEALNAHGFTNISALDISQQSLNLSEKKGVYKKLICAYIGEDRMPFDDDEFDAVVCSGGVSPGRINPVAFREWSRIVKPGGVLLFSMRRSYLEVVQGEEGFCQKEFIEEFNEVLEDLKNTRKVETMYKKEFPDYIPNTPGVIYAIKVL